MKVLVTGAAGFIGSHLVDYHVKKGDEVWALDSLATSSRKNIDWIKNRKDLRFTQANLIDWQDLDKALLWADRVYHMAALLGQKYVFTHAFAVISENIKSCERLISLIKEKKEPIELLIASSSCVYGTESHIIDQDETTPMQVSSFKFFQETYPASKIVNEVMAQSLSNFKNIHCVTARFFNIIGPHQNGRYGMVVPTFIKQALAHEPITVYGDGQQTRSFCSVHDAILATEHLFSSDQSKHQVYNIGNPSEIKIIDLAHLIKKMTNSSSQIIFVPYKEAYGIDYEEIQRRCPNIEKLKKDTSFSPSITLEDALQDIIEEERKNL